MLFDLLTQSLGGNTVKQMSSELGCDEKQTGQALSTAIPMLMGALTRNSSSQSGAASLFGALTKDHDGSILDNLGGFLGSGSSGPGDGILKHLLGNKRPSVERAVSQSSGLDIGSVGKLLTMLAPLVMGALGQVQKKKSLDSGGLSDLLKGEMRTAQKKSPVDLGILSILDSDGDGNVMDDVAKIGGGLLSSFFKK